MIRKYELAVFDMDGTILYTLDDICNGVNEALVRHGLPRRDIDSIRRNIGHGIRHEIESSVPEGTDESVIDAVFHDFHAWYEVHCNDNTRPYEGIVELLQSLKEEGIRCAVVSNKADYAVQALCRQYFPGQFDMAVGQREGIRSKPAPDSVYAVLRRLAIDPDRAVFIGDSDVDVETAQNAGLPCWAVDWGYRDRAVLEAAGATAVFSNAAALQQALLGLE